MKANLKKRIRQLEKQTSDNSESQEAKFKELMELFPGLEPWDTENPWKEILDSVTANADPGRLPNQKK